MSPGYSVHSLYLFLHYLWEQFPGLDIYIDLLPSSPHVKRTYMYSCYQMIGSCRHMDHYYGVRAGKGIIAFSPLPLNRGGIVHVLKSYICLSVPIWTWMVTKGTIITILGCPDSPGISSSGDMQKRAYACAMA